MKTILIILLAVCAFPNSSDAQISLSKDGFQPSEIITETDSLSAAVMYERALNWVKKNYKQPDAVIMSRIENSMIRIEGRQLASAVTNWAGTSGGIDIEYTLEMEFKEGKYKLNFMSFDTTYNAHRAIFNKKGNTRTKQGEEIKKELENSVNFLVSSITDAIDGISKDNW